jgi:hypothetical protein
MLEDYAAMTTAILDNIGHEIILQNCDICGNPRSIDLDRMYREVLPKSKPETKPNIVSNAKGRSKPKGKHNDDNEDMTRHYIGRDWFPLAGSIGSDAQALPAASRSLNCCAKCLFAVQYLPQAVFSMKGRLTVFSSTSVTFWYRLAKQFAGEIKKRLAGPGDKVETIGTKKEGGVNAAITRILVVLRDLDRSDIAATGSVTMWQFANGQSTDCYKERIPNFALSFLYECAKHVPTDHIINVISKERKSKSKRKSGKGYQYPLLDKIINRQDYLPLYPSRKYANDGASQKLFMLYQTIVMGYQVNSLRTASKIAGYVKDKAGEDDSAMLGIDLDKRWDKQVRVRRLIVDMVGDGQLIFDEYYELLISGTASGISHQWQLIKYYLLSELPALDLTVEDQKQEDWPTRPASSAAEAATENRYKVRLIAVGKAIHASYVRRKGSSRFQREVLYGWAHNQLDGRWLWNQFKILTLEAKEDGSIFDAQRTWKALGADDNLYELLYLLRLLWNSSIFIKR